MQDRMDINGAGAGDDDMTLIGGMQDDATSSAAMDDDMMGGRMTLEEDEAMDAGEGDTIVIVEEVVTPVLIIAEDGYDMPSDGAAAGGTIGRLKSAIGNAGEAIQSAAGSSVGAAKQAGSVVVSTVRQNPFPAALVGVGLGWILLNAVKGDGQKSDGRASKTKSDETPTGAPGKAADRTADAAGNLAEQAQQTVKQAAGKAQDVAGQLLETAQTAGGKVVETAQGVVGHVVNAGQWVGRQAVEKASELPAQVADGAKRAGSYAQQTMTEKPAAAGAIALGVGAAIGLALPRTQVESRLMGGAKDKLLGEVGTAVQGAVDKMQKIVE